MLALMGLTITDICKTFNARPAAEARETFFGSLREYESAGVSVYIKFCSAPRKNNFAIKSVIFPGWQF